MSREDSLRKLLDAIERQKQLGFREDMEPLELAKVEALERRTLERLAYVKLLRPDYRGIS